ncbi:MAG: 23S rRNA (pseudouridine(1915)-N(3))-methyltransferase RlmH [Candidatus Taylorbacteria bacterium]|nr:23S rRNA (pseudouridine(1915)-N(3))-methyltransferase RlmH [Candidatus Taylorbacteria bacterium]
MKILLISVGKKHDPAFLDAITDFTHRISHYTPVEWKFLNPSDNIKSESVDILASVNERDYVVLLDERGKQMSSPDLAQFLEKRLNESVHRLVFIIGGAFGVDEEVRKRAHTTIALSQLVFPHQLVRLILAEQIYRAFTILRGEKYHHE